MSCLSIPGLTQSPTKNKGQIQIILGPMFSGKSTELLRRVRRYEYANHKCMVIKYSKDVRYSEDMMATHDKQKFLAVQAERLSEVEVAGDVSVVGIDEGQFFPDVVEFCEGLANQGIRVVVAALDGTFERKAFGAILNLIPLAESVVKLNAVCMICYGQAAFTKRLGSEKQIEIIGGADKYMSVCRECHRTPGTASPLRKPLKAMNLNKLYDSTPPFISAATLPKQTIPSRQLFR